LGRTTPALGSTAKNLSRDQGVSRGKMSETSSGGSGSPEDLSTVLSDLTGQLEGIMEKLKQGAQESISEFVTKKVFVAASGMGLYVKSYERLQIQSRQELEDLCEKHRRDKKVEEAQQDLLEVEGEWNRFLASADKEAFKSGDFGPAVQVGDPAPLDLELVDISNSQQVSLQELVGQQTLLLVLLRHLA